MVWGHGPQEGNFSNLDLWLAGLPDFCLLSAKQEAVDRGLVSPGWRLGTPALLDGDSACLSG